MRANLRILLIAVLTAIAAFVVAPVANAAVSTVVPPSSVSTRHAYHGAANHLLGFDYYWLTFTSKRAWNLHLYARHCSTTPSTTTDGDGHPVVEVYPAYLQVSAANERTPDAAGLDYEVRGVRSAVLLEPMAAGKWTVYLKSTCSWGLSVPNRVRYVAHLVGAG